MLRTDDQSYYTRRTAEERQRGDHATNAIVASIHYELATRYSILAARTGAGTPSLTLVDCGKEQLAA